MTLEILTLPCLTDNYAFLIGNPETGEAAVVDVPEAAPINRALQDKGWVLTTVLLTHHHDDHTQGLGDLDRAPDVTVIGAKADAHRLPPLDRAVSAGEVLEICGTETHVIDVSGHTVGHIAFHMPSAQAAFTADSLMALGCGRVFEGTMEMMWDSLSRLAALPLETILYSGHEYTTANGKFALTIEPDNPALQTRIANVAKARASGRPTVPSTLAEELATNPFLRATEPAVQATVGMTGADPAQVFAEIRRRKDTF